MKPLNKGQRVTVWRGNIGECGIITEAFKLPILLPIRPKLTYEYKVELDGGRGTYIAKQHELTIENK
jgi:hypothetical protein